MRTIIISCFCGAGEKLVEDNGFLTHSETIISKPCEKHQNSVAYEILSRLLPKEIEYIYGG